MKKYRLAGVSVLAAGAIIVGGGAAAMASIPDSDDGEIHGCYQRVAGNLRVIDAESGETCRPFEEPLTFNQEGARGPAGPQGPAGERGPAGPRGPAGVSGYEIVRLPNANVGRFERRVVNCPPGKEVLGGGAEARGNNAILVGSFPTDDGTGWIGLGRQPGASSVGISVFAMCADVR